MAGEVDLGDPPGEKQLVDEVDAERVASLPPPPPRLGGHRRGDVAGKILAAHRQAPLDSVDRESRFRVAVVAFVAFVAFTVVGDPAASGRLEGAAADVMGKPWIIAGRKHR